jgi:hypothetical protein
MAAQAIHCDWEGHLDALADVMVTRLENGDTTAWCFPHYVEISRAAVDTFDAAIAAQQDAEVAERMAGVSPPSGADPGGDAGGAPASPGAPADEPEGTPSAGEPGDSEASVPAPGSPDLAVGTFREAGDEPVQAGVRGPETGEPAPDAAGPAGELTEPPGPPDAATEDAGEPEAAPAEAEPTR